jgi:hypothetical protein
MGAKARQGLSRGFLTQRRKGAKAWRGKAATKRILQKQTKETKSRKNSAKNAQFLGIALQRVVSVFATFATSQSVRITHFRKDPQSTLSLKNPKSEF